MFEFDHLWVFALLPLPFLFYALLPVYRERRESVRIPHFESVAQATGSKPGRGGVALRRSTFTVFTGALCWALIVCALAKPQYVEPPINKTEAGRDLMLAIDLSGSMDTSDMFAPDSSQIQRIEAVQLVVDDFIRQRASDRIGVIVFGNQAFVLSPFTTDHELVRTLLAGMRPRMAGPQTMIGDAIGLSIKTFENSQARDRVLILLTDGNDTGSKVPPEKAAEIAALDSIRVHTIAVGDPSSAGEAQMDLAVLEKVAAISNGVAFRADDREGLASVYEQIDAMTPEEIETISYRPTRPLYHYPVGAALIVTLLYHLVQALLSIARQRRLRHA